MTHEIITLSSEQVRIALEEAERRQSYNESKGYRGRNGASARGKRALEFHKVGCLGEMAAAVYFNHPTPFDLKSPVRGSNDLKNLGVEVKTRSKHHYDLIIQANEDPAKTVVLLTIEKSEIRIHGWVTTGTVMRKEFWKDPAGGRPAYFVPKSELNPLSTFPLKVNYDRSRPPVDNYNHNSI